MRLIMYVAKPFNSVIVLVIFPVKESHSQPSVFSPVRHGEEDSCNSITMAKLLVKST